MKNYDFLSLMVDCSRNATLTVDSIKKLILILKKIGYTSLMLYTEDTYEVINQPYFGYLRGRYSVEQLQEISKFGDDNGIEVVPCIQTLAHLNCIFRHQKYAEINDINDILLVDDGRTYKLIDDMFSSLEKEFTSRKVHIGCDEAHMLGLGKFKDLHGIEDRTDIFIRHLNKVKDIAFKHGFKPMMWSDMFFRLVSGGEYYDINAKISKEKIKKVPQDLSLVYWDYYHPDRETYEAMIKIHKQINPNDLYFAGGVWAWNGFAPLLSHGEANALAGVSTSIDNGIRNIIMTAWGDNGAECSLFSSLTTIFYAKEVADGIVDINKIKQDFFNVLGLNYDDFKLLELPNFLTNKAKGRDHLLVDPCKYLLFNDPLQGYFDCKTNYEDEKLYEEYALKLKEAGKRNEEYAYLFNYLSSLCHLLAIKATLGAHIREAYQSKDKNSLSSYLPLIDETIVRLNDFCKECRNRWLKENNRSGLEVQQIRLGGLKERLIETKTVLKEYLDGKISSISELEEKILPIDDNGKDPMYFNMYSKNATVNDL